MSALQERLRQVHERIAAAEQRVGVTAGSVRLVAVTKYSSLQTIQELHELGIRHLGESRPQQLAARASQLPTDLAWHLIGPLQTNKINKVVSWVHLVHSLDSIDLAHAISKRALGLQLLIPVLLEVKTSNEVSKSGVPLAQAGDAYAQVAALPGLQLRGLMTMAPHTDDEGAVRRSFGALRKLFDSLSGTDSDPEILSMGMSEDFEWAIEEGANLVRIGRALVGD